ncbi:MAG TPA: contractile injection system protein, VgrG/Pvc8 family [Longimicrobiaceae bacterium]|nr:contractile injection system protein, VgrG/Pvc8 family [Longimicrobiaceae bacterium]
MPAESIVIEFAGEEDPDLYADVAGLEVELSDEGPASFRLSLRLYRRPEDGSWAYLDEERFRVWSEVAIRLGYADAGPEEVLSGYVTRVTPRFARDEGQSVLEVWGMDSAVRMDREERLKAWPNKKDADIAAEILASHGFAAEVEDTPVVHDEALSTVVQRETDYRFLRRLALRNGFACWVEGTTGHFGPVPADPEPQPLLAAHFGAETTLRSFTATVDGLRPAAVSMYQVDRLTGEVLTAEVESAAREPLGALDAAALLSAGDGAGRVYVAKNAATGAPEMTALCQGLFHEGAWLVSGEGEVDALAYAHVLRPRATVTIKGVGESYSGVWYVSWVRHVVGPDGYTQQFRARRDALLPTGDEDFGGGGGLGLL